MIMNSLEKIRLQLDHYVQLNDQEWEYFRSKLKKKNYAAKHMILEAGDTANHFIYIVKGLIRVYYLKDGKEVNTYFSCDNQFVSVYSSFVTQSPSFEYMEVLEDTSVYYLTYKDGQDIFSAGAIFERLGRLMAEKHYLFLLSRTLKMQSKDAKARYLDFISTEDKKIVQQVPQQMIASYLGIAPESLSRIKKQMLN